MQAIDAPPSRLRPGRRQARTRPTTGQETRLEASRASDPAFRQGFGQPGKVGLLATVLDGLADQGGCKTPPQVLISLRPPPPAWLVLSVYYFPKKHFSLFRFSRQIYYFNFS